MAKNVIASNTTHNKPQIRSYQSRVAEQCLRNPCLQSLSQFLSNNNLYRNACLIACLEFSSVSANPYREDLDLKNLDSLLNNKVRGSKEIQGRLLLIEDLSKDVIELLGSSLNYMQVYTISRQPSNMRLIQRARLYSHVRCSRCARSQVLSLE